MSSRLKGLLLLIAIVAVVFLIGRVSAKQPVLEVEKERDACQTRIRQLDAEIIRYQDTVTYYQNELTRYQNEVTRYENMKIIKIRAFAARIYKGLKRRAKKLLKRGEKA